MRVRHKGFPDQIITMPSLEAAEQLLLRIQAERASGLLIDYSSARRVTMAQLVERYLSEECPKHKGASTEGYTLRGMLADSRGELEQALRKLDRAKKAGQSPPLGEVHLTLLTLQRPPGADSPLQRSKHSRRQTPRVLPLKLSKIVMAVRPGARRSSGRISSSHTAASRSFRVRQLLSGRCEGSVAMCSMASMLCNRPLVAGGGTQQLFRPLQCLLHRRCGYEHDGLAAGRGSPLSPDQNR